MLSLEHQVHELVEHIKYSNPGLLSQLHEDLNRRGQSVQDIATAIKNAAEQVGVEVSRNDDKKMSSKAKDKKT